MSRPPRFRPSLDPDFPEIGLIGKVFVILLALWVLVVIGAVISGSVLLWKHFG